MNAPRRVLIVDDSSMMRLIIARYLDGSPFTVVAQAVDGADAIVQAAQLSPDIVLMDVVMPGRSSLECLREMMAANPRLIVVMASSLGTQKTVHEFLQAGARNFVQKPFTRDALLKVLHHGITVAAG